MNKKDIPGYEGIYYATIDGKIFSYPAKLKFGINTRNVDGKEKSQFNHAMGYSVCQLYTNKKSKTFLVHRIIALTFIPNPENKPMVNHKDGNKKNNHVSNLEWVTRQENEIHAISIGKKPRGEKNGASKISDIDAEYIRTAYKKRNGVGLLSKMFGITTHQVRRIGVGDSRSLPSAP